MTVRGFGTAVRWVLAGTLTACFPAPPEGAEPVVVVHGLGRTPASMAVLEQRIEAAGYRVVSFGYPSTSEPMEELVERLDDEVERCCGEHPHGVHFVTHSMGGVLVRLYLAGQAEPHEGRVVMLSPPSQGSELIDAFADSPLLQLVVGPAGADLGTDTGGVARRLEPPDYSLGIITGDRSLNPIASWLIPGPDDGKVSVERARAQGATDFLVLPATHTFIMNREDVAAHTLHFLETGRFDPTLR